MKSKDLFGIACFALTIGLTMSRGWASGTSDFGSAPIQHPPPSLRHSEAYYRGKPVARLYLHPDVDYELSTWLPWV